MFGLKLLWAGMFGGTLMLLIVLTMLLWGDDWPLARWDALFLAGLAAQGLLLWRRLESTQEAMALVVFAALGLGLELFNTALGNWSYPGAALFSVADVPLFVGFMYAAVGVFVLRLVRIFRMRFAPFPPVWLAMALAALIYGNFFVQHLWIDLRAALFVATVLLFWRTRVWMLPMANTVWWLPGPLALFLMALCVWLAENMGTVSGTWLYEGQDPGDLVGVATLGSWYLFFYVAMMVALAVLPAHIRRAALDRDAYLDRGLDHA